MNFLKKHARFPHPKFIELIRQMYESTPLTLLTLTELNALVAANGLKTGMQYKLTDKNWNLIATSVKTVKPLFGIILILNGETLPAFLDTDVFYVDSGQISTDLNNTPLIITGKLGYYVEHLVFKNTSSNYLVATLTDSADVQLFKMTAATMKNQTSVLLTNGSSSSDGLFKINPNSETYKLFIGFAGTYSARVILKFQRSLF